MIQESYNSPFVSKADYQEQTKIMVGGFNDVHKRVDKLEVRFDGLEVRFDKLEVKFDEKFAKVDQKFDDLTEIMMDNFDKVDVRFNEIKNDLNLIIKHLGVKDATISA